jgi:hypothetical protein
MTTVTGTQPTLRPRGRSGAVVRALALAESRRMLRNPVLWVGAGLSVWAMWSVVPDPDEWPGASYESIVVSSVPLLFAISVVVAVSFHRERVQVAAAAPVGEPLRILARLVAALPLVLVTVGFAALLAWRQRDIGGLSLGMEPGRTTEALFSTGELAQPVALAVLAVAIGAALGRRMSHLASAVPLLFGLWFLVSIYWLFQLRVITPFSILQAQPIRVYAGTPSTDPLSFPAHWLLEAPGEFSEQWNRVFVSGALAWWHAVWLLGLSALWIAVVVPRGRARRWLVVGGTALAIVGVIAQFRVLP